MYESKWNTDSYIIFNDEPSNIEEEIIYLMNEWQFDTLERDYDNYIADLVSDYFFNIDY